MSGTREHDLEARELRDEEVDARPAASLCPR